MPGSLASNAAGTSVSITGAAEIVGDIDSVGTATLASSVNVTGKVANNGQVQNLPAITVESYDPAGQPGVQNLTSASYTSTKSYTGSVRRAGDVTYSSGVNLNQAVLYVDGDLEIDGAVNGTGAIFATGKVTLRGGADLSSSNLCAVVANGDVRVLGNGQNRSYFNGLIYTKGQGGFAGQDASLDLVVKDVTVQGCVISAGTASAGGSKMQVDNSAVIYAEAGTKVGFNVTLPTPPNATVQSVPYPVQWNLQINGQSVPPTVANLLALGQPPGVGDFTYFDPSGNVPVTDGPTMTSLYNNGGLSQWVNNNIIPMITPPPNAAVTTTLNLDLNQFLQAATQMRVVYRKT